MQIMVKAILPFPTKFSHRSHNICPIVSGNTDQFPLVQGPLLEGGPEGFRQVVTRVAIWREHGLQALRF